MNMVERWGMSEKLGYVAHRHLTGGISLFPPFCF
jgi:hypothetical protein